MQIRIEEMYDSLYIYMDDKCVYSMDQEDTHAGLKEALEEILYHTTTDATVTYEVILI